MKQFVVTRIKRTDYYKHVKPFVIMGYYNSYAEAQRDADCRPSDSDRLKYVFEVDETKNIQGL